MGDILPPPKRQAVVERLRRRIEFYRRHQNASFPRYDQAANGLFDQQKHDTLLLKQRYLESKAKKAKKSDHKSAKENAANSESQRSLLAQKLKRPAEGSPGIVDEGPPQTKVSTPEPLPSFSVQIVQQFTSNASSQSQHSIQTNVTVKALSGRAPTPPPPPPPQPPPPPLEVECKQERVEDEFAACGEDTFAQLGFTEDSNDDEIHPDILKELFDDDELFTNHTDLMKDFNFEESVKDLDKVLPPFSPTTFAQQANALFDGGGGSATSFSNSPTSGGPRYQTSFGDFKLRDPSPAAQTLKQMAEQHQNMQQLGLYMNGQKGAFLQTAAAGNFAPPPPQQQQQQGGSPPEQKPSPYATTRPLTHYTEPGGGNPSTAQQGIPPAQYMNQQQATAATPQQTPAQTPQQQQFQPSGVQISQTQQIQIQGPPPQQQQHIQVTQAQQINQEVKTEVVYPRYTQQQPTYQMSQTQSVTFNPQSYGNSELLRQQQLKQQQQQQMMQGNMVVTQQQQQRQMQQFVNRPPPEYKGQVVNMLTKPQRYHQAPRGGTYEQCGPPMMRPDSQPITSEMLYAAQQQQVMSKGPANNSKPPIYTTAHLRHRSPNVNVGPDGLNITQRLPSMVQVTDWRPTRPMVQQRMQYRAPVIIQQQPQQQQPTYSNPNVAGAQAARPNLQPQPQRHRLQQRPPAQVMMQQQQQVILQHAPSQIQMTQQQQMYVHAPAVHQPTDSSHFSLDFLDSIDSSASDLLNFEQVMQQSGNVHFNILDEMGMLGK